MAPRCDRRRAARPWRRTCPWPPRRRRGRRSGGGRGRRLPDVLTTAPARAAPADAAPDGADCPIPTRPCRHADRAVGSVAGLRSARRPHGTGRHAGGPDRRGGGLAATAAPSRPRQDDGTLAGLIGAAVAARDPRLRRTRSCPAMRRLSLRRAPGAAAGPLRRRHRPACRPGQRRLARPVEPACGTPASAAALAPPAPEGGGWWTRGGAHVPPMVWPLPGLPDPADFAYLLEAAA